MSSQSVPQSVVDRGVGMGLSGVSASTLKSWYQEYAAHDGSTIHSQSAVVRAVESDVLDYEGIEAQVQQLMPIAEVIDGFCAKCQHLLEHWPMFPTGTSRKDAVGKQFHTNEVEAAARQGCIFCALLLSEMEHENVLDTFRKIEVRLRDIGNGATFSLSIFGSEEPPDDSQGLWIDFPGKKALKSGQITSPTVFLISDILPPSGEPA